MPETTTQAVTCQMLDSDTSQVIGQLAAPARRTIRLHGAERCVPGRTVLLDEDHDQQRSILAPIVEVGAYWSNQPAGQSGYYVTVAVPEDWGR